MDALKDFFEDGGEGLVQEKKKDKSDPKKNSKINAKNIALAKMYEDAAEYEEELVSFEKELEIINANSLKDIVEVLTKELPDDTTDYAKELKSTLVAIWTYKVETEKTHTVEQLNLIKQTEFCDVVEKMAEMEPDYKNDFEAEVKQALIKRLEIFIAIKKEHIKEEETEIKIAGLKPSFVKRIYKQVHGIA